MKDMFIIDLNKKDPKVDDYLIDDIQFDLDHFGYKEPMQLDSYDFKIFVTQKKAEEWLKIYKKILTGLDNKDICRSRDLPAILLKRRYMVQALMGEKLQTYRKYSKDWKPGQLFNFHDQTFFLTVKLITLEKDGKNGYCYKYKLA